MEFDDILTNYVGELGRYQVLIMCYGALVVFPCSYYPTESVFQAGKMSYWCLPQDLPTDIRANHTRDQLLSLVAPADQQNGRQCEIIDRDYSSLTYENVTEILTGNTSDFEHLPSIPCEEWMYYSDEFQWTTVAEVNYRNVFTSFKVLI